MKIFVVKQVGIDGIIINVNDNIEDLTNKIMIKYLRSIDTKENREKMQIDINYMIREWLAENPQ